MATPTYNPAYKSKSDLVNAGYGGYSSWNDEASIMANYKETGGEGKYTGGANPSSADQLPGYLDNYQSNLFGNIAMPDLKIPTADELKKSLTPTTPAPTPINRSAMLEEQKTKLGVGDLETELNTLKNEERQIQAQLRETTGAEEGKTVALNVMSGRITEEQRQAQTKLDYLNVRKATLVDELNTKYNAINTFIQFAGLDYNDAVKAYEGEFDRNVKVQEMLSGYRKEAWTYTTDAIKLQEQIKQDAINNARANLTTITNAITSGNMTWDSLPSDQKLQIQKLEIQSGLPVGTVSKLQLSAKDKILGWSDDKTQAMVLDGNGGFKVVKTGLTKSTSGTGTADERKQTQVGKMGQYMESKKNSYGHVSPQVWAQAKAAWVSDGLSVDDFNAQFRSYTDPNRGDFETAYGFPKTFRTTGKYSTANTTSPLE